MNWELYLITNNEKKVQCRKRQELTLRIINTFQKLIFLFNAPKLWAQAKTSGGRDREVGQVCKVLVKHMKEADGGTDTGSYQ